MEPRLCKEMEHVQRRRIDVLLGQHGMDLTAMVGLVVEQGDQDTIAAIGESATAGQGATGQGAIGDRAL